MTDIIDEVLGSAVPIRQSRPTVVAHTQGVYEALFEGEVAFGRERSAVIAARVATLAGAPELARHYSEIAGAERDSDATLDAALDHAERLTTAPATSTRAHIAALAAAGLSEHDIVTLTQLVGYVNYQVRLLAGLTLLGGAA
ncbi:hypothetical protein [Nocardia panacis]|uniref:hypothetical protein n=1 Tax=Nocardia panacis TaxID=2340916 RepID=UPI0011C4A990|nr:hypothetical protein [Nocardia panacis]